MKLFEISTGNFNIIFKGINYRKMQKKNRNFQNFKLVVPLKWFFSRLRWNGHIPCLQFFFQISFFKIYFQNLFFQHFSSIDYKSSFRTCHCTHTNTAFSTEIERKVTYATREESERFSSSVKLLHKINLFFGFQVKTPYSYAYNGAWEIDYFWPINAQ